MPNGFSGARQRLVRGEIGSRYSIQARYHVSRRVSLSQMMYLVAGKDYEKASGGRGKIHDERVFGPRDEKTFQTIGA